jgi:hypothetical protein
MTVSAAIAEDLLSSEELDELFKISASESGPEDDDEEEDDESDDDGEEMQPEDMPHG